MACFSDLVRWTDMQRAWRFERLPAAAGSGGQRRAPRAPAAQIALARKPRAEAPGSQDLLLDHRLLQTERLRHLWSAAHGSKGEIDSSRGLRAFAPWRR
jgi:hypothetical protein